MKNINIYEYISIIHNNPTIIVLENKLLNKKPSVFVCYTGSFVHIRNMTFNFLYLYILS